MLALNNGECQSNEDEMAPLPANVSIETYNIFTEVNVMIGIRPLGDRVVIKKVEAEEKTQGGLILTSSAKEQPQMAEVVAVGPGTKDEAMELKEGDKVVFSKYGGTEDVYKRQTYGR